MRAEAGASTPRVVARRITAESRRNLLNWTFYGRNETRINCKSASIRRIVSRIETRAITAVSSPLGALTGRKRYRARKGVEEEEAEEEDEEGQYHRR